MKKLIKPNALNAGDTIMAVSLSSGAANMFPERYQQGKRQIQESFDLKIIESKHALCTPEELYNHPDWRLNDLMEAFLNPEIKGIICTNGGEDTIRLLRLMDQNHFDVIRNNPKVFLGISDSTVNHFMCYKAGLSSFYSPSLMFGYGENGGIPNYTIESTKKTLFKTNPIGVLPENKDGFLINKGNWALDNTTPRLRTPSTPWRYIGGANKTHGRLIGGCFDVLMEYMNGTTLFPSIPEFKDTILFLETSEDMPSPDMVSWWFRGLGAMGILDNISGILFGRPGGEFTDTKKRDEYLKIYEDFDTAILKILKEYDRLNIPVVTNVDFGHTGPHLLLPFGALTEIDPFSKTVSILESGVL